MAYKIAAAVYKTGEEFDAERLAKISDKKTDDDKAAMRAFGFTDAEAKNALDRYVTTASGEPISDAWDYSPSGVWYLAYELAEQLDADNGAEFVNDAMNAAETPKQFWELLKNKLTDDADEVPEVQE